MPTPRIDRRTALAGGIGIVTSLAGCISTSRTPPGSRGTNSGDEGGGSESTSPLTSDGSSTVYPVTSKASSYWNSNRPADDTEYWGPNQYGIDTDEALADYWAGLYGFENEGSTPPFRVNVAISHSGTGIEKVERGQIDVGSSSAPVSAELSEATDEELEKFTDHVVAVDAQPLVVSQEIYDAGVTQLTADQVRKVYRGEISNWSEIDAYDGPDKEIQAIGRAVGSGTDTAFRLNMLGSADAPMGGVDSRKGQNQQVKNIVKRSDNALAYLALAFIDDSIPAIGLEFDGTLYEPGKNLAEQSYPLSRDLHCYTYDGTSKKEAAFLRMIISDYGQQNFVEPEGYAMLTESRREKQLAKLPDTEN